MKKSFVDFLQCTRCSQGFSLSIEAEDEKDHEVITGKLRCACTTFPIQKGIPRLLYGATDQKNWETAARFGEEWTDFSMLTPEYEQQFLSWIEPVKSNYFSGKRVLDVGCGKGRHIIESMKFGAKEVVGIDLSHAVETAYAHIGRNPGVHIAQADIFELPLKPVFDYAYSIGVLHHTPNPKKAFLSMTDKVKSGGGVSAWVYGREGNGWIIYIINPIRKITSRLPLTLTKALAFLLTCILWTGLKTVYREKINSPFLRRLQTRLPYEAYLTSIAGYTFRENFSIVFDHLLPEIAFYIRKDEFESWFQEASLKNTTITSRYNNSWRGFAEKH